MEKIQINVDSEERLSTLHGVGPIVCQNIMRLRENSAITRANLAEIAGLRITQRLLEQIDFSHPEDEIDSEGEEFEEDYENNDPEEAGEYSETEPKGAEGLSEAMQYESERALAERQQRILDAQQAEINKLTAVSDQHIARGGTEKHNPGLAKMTKASGAIPKTKVEPGEPPVLPNFDRETKFRHEPPKPSSLDMFLPGLMALLEAQKEISRATAENQHLLARQLAGGDKARPRDDRRREDPKSFNIPKTLSYDGKALWRPFIKKFNSFCARQGWGPELKRDVMMWCLTDKASEYYTCLLERQPNLTFREIESALKTRFGKKDFPEKLMSEFMTEGQKEGEDLEDWADRIFDLGFRAYPEIAFDKLQGLAVTRFCQGCLDKAAGQAVIANPNRPASMDAAVKAVQWYRLNHQVIYGKRADSKHVKAVELDDSEPHVQVVTNLPVRPRNSGGQVRPNTNAKGNSDSRQFVAPTRNSESITGRLEAVEKKLDDVMSALRGLTPQSGTVVETAQKTAGCFYCKQEGHFARECPHKRKRHTISQVAESNEQETLNESGSEEEA